VGNNTCAPFTIPSPQAKADAGSMPVWGNVVKIEFFK
jgi:hypothetical protein